MVELIKCAKERDYNVFGRELTPEPGVVYSPWVKMRFAVGNKTITVGNDSLYTIEREAGKDVFKKGDNTAVIKSFEYGTTDGYQCNITVHDQSGSNFAAFMRHIITDLKPSTGSNAEVYVSFGWCRIDCEGKVLKDSQKSCKEFKMHGMDIDIAFSEGLFVYNFSGADLGRNMIEATKVDGIIGQDGTDESGRRKGIAMTKAIEALMSGVGVDGNTPPYVDKVRFLKDNGINNDPVPIRFRNGNGITNEEGIIGKWNGNQRDKLNTAKAWIRDYPAEDGATAQGAILKAVEPRYNTCDGKDEIIFWQSNEPAPCEKTAFEKFTVGFYYVNGGKDSRVIEFNPRMKTNFSMLNMAGGNMPKGRAFNENANKVSERPCADSKKGIAYKSAGTETSINPDPNLEDANKQNADFESGRAQAVQDMTSSLTFKEVQATLTIVGDPEYMGYTHVGRCVTIVFINPFYLSGSLDENSCPDWTVSPDPCNEVLTNRGWFIKSISHRIQEGSFTTTLDLYLPRPSISLEPGNNFGGDPTGFKL
jgi:hypothetical protein